MCGNPVTRAFRLCHRGQLASQEREGGEISDVPIGWVAARFELSVRPGTFRFKRRCRPRLVEIAPKRRRFSALFCCFLGRNGSEDSHVRGATPRSRPQVNRSWVLAKFTWDVAKSVKFGHRTHFDDYAVYRDFEPSFRVGRYTRNAEIDQILTPGVRSLSDSACSRQLRYSRQSGSDRSA
jgi:hypothetical protein